MGYNDIITRQDSSDPLVPEQFRAELVGDLPAGSAVLAHARQVPLSSKTSRQPVLSLLPEAYWVSGDTGLKETTKADWRNSIMTAEEIAVLVPIPEAYLDDAAIPIWASVRPLVAEAIAKRIDEAVLFGVGKPATWTDPAIVPGAVAAGNVVTSGTGEDLGVDIAEIGRLVAEDGYAVNGFVGEPGFNWRLVGMRGQDGGLIYGPSIAQGQPGTLYGQALTDVRNGAWNSSEAHIVGGDWSQVLIGIRQDITYKVFTEGVITDSSGKVLLNLMQQDSVALRVVMRLGYSLPIPASRLADDRFPFGVLKGGAKAAPQPRTAAK